MDHSAVGAREDGLLVRRHRESGDGVVATLLFRHLHRAEFLAIRQVPDADLGLLAHGRQDRACGIEAEKRGLIRVIESPQQFPRLIVDRDRGRPFRDHDEPEAVRSPHGRVGLELQCTDSSARVGFDEDGGLIANGDEVLGARGVPEAGVSLARGFVGSRCGYGLEAVDFLPAGVGMRRWFGDRPLLPRRK